MPPLDAVSQFSCHQTATLTVANKLVSSVQLCHYLLLNQAPISPNDPFLWTKADVQGEGGILNYEVTQFVCPHLSQKKTSQRKIISRIRYSFHWTLSTWRNDYGQTSEKGTRSERWWTTAGGLFLEIIKGIILVCIKSMTAFQFRWLFFPWSHIWLQPIPL